MLCPENLLTPVGRLPTSLQLVVKHGYNLLTDVGRLPISLQLVSNLITTQPGMLGSFSVINDVILP